MQRFIRRKKNRNKKAEWVRAQDIEVRIKKMISSLDLYWIPPKQIHCFRSQFTTTRAYARIWGLSRIWQLALEIKPVYIIEVISEKFDKLPHSKQDEILLHELAHIPKTFSGAMLPHTKHRKGSFHDKLKDLLKAHAERIDR